MKVLYVTTIGGTMGFFGSFIKRLTDQGHRVDIAANEQLRPIPQYYHDFKCGFFHLSCTRSPFSKENIKAVKELRKIVENGKYDIVHCHTPIAAACTRLACRNARKDGTKVIYTAHGFHFYTGAPIANWIIYYPVEKWLSRYTDVLITINSEDYQRALKKFRIKKIVHVNGVGIDISRFETLPDRNKIRDQFGIGNRFMLLSVGELNANKNHEAVIKALSKLGNPQVVYVIAGRGEKDTYLKNLAEESGVELILAGYRNDITYFYAAADAYIHPSIREGLSVATLEAMASGLPCLAGKIRGSVDLIDEKKGGYLFNPLDADSVKTAVERMLENHDGMGGYNREKAKQFDKKKINDVMMKIYEEASVK